MSKKPTNAELIITINALTEENSLLREEKQTLVDEVVKLKNLWQEEKNKSQEKPLEATQTIPLTNKEQIIKLLLQMGCEPRQASFLTNMEDLQFKFYPNDWLHVFGPKKRFEIILNRFFRFLKEKEAVVKQNTDLNNVRLMIKL